MLGRYCLSITILLVLIVSFLIGSSVNAQYNNRYNNSEKVISVASALVKASFPEIWDVISNTTPKIQHAQPGEYGEALSGFPIYVVEWSVNGVDVSVLVAVVGNAVTPVGIEATVNGQASEIAGKLVYSLGNRVLSEVKAFYNELIKEVSDGNVEIIGFQIHVNETPVAFIEPSRPSIVPATLSWNVYFVRPVLAFSVFNDYPLVKAAITNVRGSLAFKVSIDDVKAILSEHKELRNVSRISKYVLIANESARPAYVVTLGPWNTAVVYADNGEFLSSKAPTTRTASPTTSVLTPKTGSNSWSLPIPPRYFPYFLSGVAMVVTAIIGIIVIRVATRKKQV